MLDLRIHYLKSIIFVTVILLSSCTGGMRVSGPVVKKIDSEEVSKIVVNFATAMKVEKHLELEDSWAYYNDDIEKFYLEFSSQRALTVYDARLILVELVEEFLYRVNNNNFVSFELRQYPLTADNLDVKINFESFYGRYIDEQYVGWLRLKNGCVRFYAFDNKDLSINGIDWHQIRFEPYVKSRELALLKRQADLPFTSDLLDAENPPKKPMNTYDRYLQPSY